MEPSSITVVKIFLIGSLTSIIGFFKPKELFSMNYIKQNIQIILFDVMDKGGFTF